jgi:hypothetical protein
VSRNLESFWAEILSNEPSRITAAFLSVSEEEQKAVIEHLKRMVEENGWSEGQSSNARAALDCLIE